MLVALVATGAAAWQLRLTSRLAVDPTPLASVPLEVDGWSGVDVPVEDQVAEMLRADFNLQRAYRHSLGNTVWVYVGYYGTQRGGRAEHTPPMCYRASGYRVADTRVVDLREAQGFRAQEMLVEDDGERRLVLFWFRSRARTGILGEFGQVLDRLRNRIATGRADGALVRVSASVENGDVDVVRSQLVQFASRFDRTLADHWPEES
jgi:EpsI family protein